MRRLLVRVEGQTEEDFVKEILAPHLLGQGYSLVAARLMGSARGRDRRGGIRSWPAARRDIVHHLREDPRCVATTMVDYYGMPQHGPRAWPGRAVAGSREPSQRSEAVEEAVVADVGRAVGTSFDARRFIPYVVMHEFEALLFSDCDGFAGAVERPDLGSSFQAIANHFRNPE